MVIHVVGSSSLLLFTADGYSIVALHHALLIYSPLMDILKISKVFLLL